MSAAVAEQEIPVSQSQAVAAAARRSVVAGTGSALPRRVVSNADLAAEMAARGIETSDEWIVARTGIRQRHIAGEGETTTSLAVRAARRALDMAAARPGAPAADARAVDLVIVATSTPDVVFPSTACLVQQALAEELPGVVGAAAFDVQAVCSGFVYALTVADAMIRSGAATRALVIGAETFSRILDWNDRGTCVLFGDGAGAIVLEAEPTATGEGGDASTARGVLGTALHADGRQSGILRTAGHLDRGQVSGHPYLTMDGQAVFKMAVTVLDQVCREAAAKGGIDIAQVDWLIPHQANVRILQSVAKKLGLPDERCVVAVDRHANTSAASVPLALDEAVRDGRIQPGQHVMLAGVGGGFTWGAALLRF